MLVYLLKSIACLALFMGFYKLCLERLSIHHFKRFYLIGALLVSIGIPAITFVQYIEPSLLLAAEHSTNPTLITPSEAALNMASTPFSWTNLLGLLYIFGLLLLTLRFFRNLGLIITKIRANEKQKLEHYTNVLVPDTIVPHTFFNYIFLNKTKYQAHQIPEEVLLHEATHAKQKHSLDVLFIEIIQLLFWFNPLLYFIKKDIKLNHEFLADQAVLNHGIAASDYQNTLLAFSSDVNTSPLANAINYSLIKKRFTLMKTNSSKQIIWLRSLLVFPLLAGLLFSFSSREQVLLPQGSETTIQNLQEGATVAQLAEYNTLAKKYNAMPKDQMIIKLMEVNRLEYLYRIMSLDQRRAAEPYPVLPPTPRAPKVPRTPEAPKVKGELSKIPPPPVSPKVPKAPKAPKAKNPLNHILMMSEKGANFFYEGKKISASKAISLIKKNPKLNISSNTNNGESTVNMSKKGFKSK